MRMIFRVFSILLSFNIMVNASEFEQKSAASGGIYGAPSSLPQQFFSQVVAVSKSQVQRGVLSQEIQALLATIANISRAQLN